MERPTKVWGGYTWLGPFLRVSRLPTLVACRSLRTHFSSVTEKDIVIHSLALRSSVMYIRHCLDRRLRVIERFGSPAWRLPFWEFLLSQHSRGFQNQHGLHKHVWEQISILDNCCLQNRDRNLWHRPAQKDLYPSTGMTLAKMLIT